MLGLSPVQIAIVLAIVLLIFGAERVPEIGRNLGRGLREFKGGIVGDPDDEPVRVPADTGEPAAPNRSLAAPAQDDQRDDRPGI